MPEKIAKSVTSHQSARRKAAYWSRFRQILGAVATVAFGAARAARADNYIWNGATGNFTDPDWTDFNNPTVHSPPGSTDNASYPSGTVTINNNTTANASVTGAAAFNLAGDYHVTSNLSDAASLNLSNTGTLFVATMTQTGGAMTMTNASLNISSTASFDHDVTDSGTSTNSFGQLLIGNTATANNTISFSGVMIDSGSAGIDTIGAAAGATSTFTAASTAWTAHGGFKVGLDGNGTLTLQNGATMQNTASASGPDLAIGGFIDPDNTVHAGTGTVTVSDSGTLWTDAKGIVAGLAGDGTLSLLNGGHVTTPNLLAAQAANSTGRIELDGAGTLLSVSGPLEIGRLGSGTMIVTNGAVVSSSSGLLATGANSTGVAQVDGLGSAWNITGAMNMGQQGLVVSTILNGSSITVGGDAILGDQASANTTLEVNGTDAGSSTPSKFNFGGVLTVANSGSAELDIQDGAVVQPTVTGNGNVVLAALSGSTGTFTVDAAGSLLRASNFYVGGTAASAGGTAQVTLTNTGDIKVANTLHLWIGSNLDVSGGGGTGGSAVVGNDAPIAGDVVVGTGGRLTGSGVIIGNLLAANGDIAPGDGIGKLSVQGNFQENVAGAIDFEIAGLTQSLYDQLSTSANLNVGGTVNVDFTGGFLPMTGQTFELFTDATTTNFNPNTQFPGIAPGFQYQWLPVTGGWDLKALSNAAPIPEPTSMLIPIGALALMRRRRAKPKTKFQ
jgi:T5SS/PEP-CTERM-associated repeat protein